jgi:hypothetical protein
MTMNVNRRAFVASLLLGRQTQRIPIEVVVLETFGLDQQTSAVLVHHAEPAGRDRFARWLQTHPRSAVWVRRENGKEIPATMFRVRMCFGRGLILLQEQVHIGEREVLIVMT